GSRSRERSWPTCRMRMPEPGSCRVPAHQQRLCRSEPELAPLGRPQERQSRWTLLFLRMPTCSLYGRFFLPEAILYIPFVTGQLSVAACANTSATRSKRLNRTTSWARSIILSTRAIHCPPITTSIQDGGPLQVNWVLRPTIE